MSIISNIIISMRLSTLFLLLATTTTAHMSMVNPAPFRHAKNPYTSSIDYDYRSPLGTFPCKGYHKDLGTAQGKSVATYTPGQTYNIELEGSAVHGGGSCQISLSYDKGQSFSVIQSYIGNCVKPDPGTEQKFAFTIPGNAPKGEAILAWSWFNTIGNREMYMNCAAVTIGSSGRRKKRSTNTDPISGLLSKRANLGPPLFQANIGNGCKTVEGSAVVFPNPGKVSTAGGGNTAAPVGNCSGSGSPVESKPGGLSGSGGGGPGGNAGDTAGGGGGSSEIESGQLQGNTKFSAAAGWSDRRKATSGIVGGLTAAAMVCAAALV